MRGMPAIALAVPAQVDPLGIINRAIAPAGNRPVIRRACLTSGGGDSTVLAHACRDNYDELVHIDTGTALPGVRDFVSEFARSIDKPLSVVEAGDAFRSLVLGHDKWWDIYYAKRRRREAVALFVPAGEHDDGWQTPDEFREETGKLETRAQRLALAYNLAPLGFPGPAGHAKAYQHLKERQIERWLRSTQAAYGDGTRQQRVMLLSGVRLDESQRRKMTGTARGEWERKGNQLWINPLTYWTNEQMRSYRKLHELPVSDVTALIHKSGECQCLAFAAKGEREFIISVFPEWYATTIRPLEDEARRRGLKRWQWGWGAGVLGIDRPAASGPLCQSCDLRMGIAA